ncbi:MAG: Mrp/NBP35 family ATP-binding protein [Candidatus Bathyarchaeia archaeon]
MVDPRISIVDERLKSVHNIIAVSSGKGGVGKSLTASTLALALAKRGYKTGLFDLDFTSPSTHVILGIEDVKPKEDKGIIPPHVHGIAYMSIIYYSGEHAAPLRGADVSNALIELLAITRWGELDFLIIDMPPGIGDATLDVIRLIKPIKFLIVTTSSQLAFETVKKLAKLLKDLKVQVVGVIENMKIGDSDFVRQETKSLGLQYLGEINFDPKIEDAIGNANELLRSNFARKIGEIASKLLFSLHL